MHGRTEVPRVINSAELTEQTLSGLAVLLTAPGGDGHQTRWLSPMLGSRAGGPCSDPIEDQSKARRSI